MVKCLKQSLNNLKNTIFYAKRPNDVSNNTCDNNCLEKKIVEEFNTLSKGLRANWLSGSGYPDIEILDVSTGTPVGYIEVKATARSDMRSPRDFYVSPGRIVSINLERCPDGRIHFHIEVLPKLTSYKIHGDAPHIMVLVKIYQLQDCSLPKGMPHECKCWKIKEFSIHDLYSLELKTKVEFNTDYHEIITNCPRL